MLGFVIGNGESRKNFNLEMLRKYKSPIWGCNGLYREFTPDVLVANDPRMVKEIKENYNSLNVLTVDRDTKIVSFKYLPYTVVESGKHWWAGPTAIYFMLKMHPTITKIFLLGFDLWGTKEGLYNNVYKDTPNYCPSDIKALPSHNIEELKNKCFTPNPNVMFYRVGNTNDAFPDSWQNLKNVSFISYEKLYAELELEIKTHENCIGLV